jgi:hypothetical protein
MDAIRLGIQGRPGQKGESAALDNRGVNTRKKGEECPKRGITLIKGRRQTSFSMMIGFLQDR